MIDKNNNKLIKKYTFIVFGIEHYNTLGLIRSLGEKGINPIYIAVKNKCDIAILSKYVDSYHLVNTIDEGYSLLIKKYGKKRNVFLYTMDDKTQELIDKNYDKLKRNFICFNAGVSGRIKNYMNKYEISNLAKKYGINVLKFEKCKKGEMPKDLKYPVITKSISSTIGGWKADVFICKNANELKKAYKKIKADTILVQEYIEKKNEYCIEGFSVLNGNKSFFGIAATYNYLLPDYYSPYMTINNMKNKELNQKLSLLLKEIKYEGLFEIEFLVDKNNNYYFCEINFRNSGWSYASTIANMNLPYLWTVSMINKDIKRSYYKKINKPFTAMLEPVDYQKRVIERKYNVKKWIYDLLKCKCLYYYGKGEDLLPFYSMIENNNLLR